MRTAVTLTLLVLLISAGIAMGKDVMKADAEPSFRIYLVDEKLNLLDETIQKRIGELKLRPDPLLTENDIKAYHWESHTIELTEKGMERFRKMIVLGKPEGRVVERKELIEAGSKCPAFVVAVNGRRAYVGGFTSCFVSVITPLPEIDLSFSDRVDEMPENSVRIGQRWKIGDGEDLREQEWIKSALTELGKLK